MLRTTLSVFSDVLVEDGPHGRGQRAGPHEGSSAITARRLLIRPKSEPGAPMAPAEAIARAVTITVTARSDAVVAAESAAEGYTTHTISIVSPDDSFQISVSVIWDDDMSAPHGQ